MNDSQTRRALAMMIALSPAMPDRSHEIEPKLGHEAIVARIRAGAVYTFNGARNVRRNKCDRKGPPLKHKRVGGCPECSLADGFYRQCTMPGVPATKVR